MKAKRETGQTAEPLVGDFIPVATPVLGDEERVLVEEAIRSGWISSQGRFVGEFEEAFSRFCRVKHGVAVSSGTAALHVALKALGVGPGDEVIIPSLTHIAVANMVALAGAKPVPVDSEASTWNMDPKHVEARITARTKVILPVHLYGHPADMDPIFELARRHGLHVVEDAAEAHGAHYKGRRIGGLGRLACFSFYANKIITTGEGGMITTDDAELAAQAGKLRDQAYEKDRRFRHEEMGFNYRMTNLQAAVGLGQMKRIDRFVEIRRRNARLYNELLAGVPGVTLPPEAAWATNVYWMYSLLVEPPFPSDRDQLILDLRDRGIDSRPFFYPVHLQPLYQSVAGKPGCPVAEKLSRAGINLPSGNDLTEAQVRRVAAAIQSCARA